MSVPPHGNLPLNMPTGPRAFTPRTQPQQRAPGPPPPPRFRSYQEPFAVQQRRNRSGNLSIPRIIIAPPPNNPPPGNFAQSLAFPGPGGESTPRHSHPHEFENNRTMNSLGDGMQHNEHPQYPSVLDPHLPKTTLSYEEAIQLLVMQAGPMIAMMKTLPDRKVTVIMYDPAGVSIFVQVQVSIKSEIDVTYLITWLQMFIDAYIAKTNYKESLLVHSIHIRNGASEEKGQLPLLAGRPWNEKIGGLDAATLILWETGGSDLEAYWTAYRSMMQLLGSSQEPMLKVFTIRLASPDKTIGRIDGKELGSGHYFKSTNGVLTAKDFFADKGDDEFLAKLRESTFEHVGNTLTIRKKEEVIGFHNDASGGGDVHGAGGRLNYQGFSSDSIRAQAIIDGRVTPSSSYRSTSLTFDTTLPKGKRLSLTERVPSKDALKAAKSPNLTNHPPMIPLSEECLKLSRELPGKWNKFRLNGKTGSTFTAYKPPFNNSDPEKSWGHYQRMGGDPLNHVAFSLDHVPFEESTFKFADNRAFNNQIISDTLKKLNMPVLEELKDPMYADKFCFITDEENGNGTTVVDDSCDGPGATSKGKGKEKEAEELSPKSLRINAYLEENEEGRGFEDDYEFYPNPTVRDASAPAPSGSTNSKSTMRGRSGQHRNSILIGLQDKLLKKISESGQQSNSSHASPTSRQSAVDALSASVAATMSACIPNAQCSAFAVSSAPSGSALNVNAPSFESPYLKFNAGGQPSDAPAYFGHPSLSTQSSQYQGRSAPPASNIAGFNMNAPSFIAASRASTPGQSINSFGSFQNFNQARGSSHSRGQSISSSPTPLSKVQFIPNTNIPNIPFGTQGMTSGQGNYHQGHTSVPSLSTSYSSGPFNSAVHQRNPSSRFFPNENRSQNLGGNNMAGNISGMSGNNKNIQNPYYQSNVGTSSSQQGGHAARSSIGGSRYGSGDFSNVNQGYPAFGQRLGHKRSLYPSTGGNHSVDQSFGSNNSYYGASASASTPAPAPASGSGSGLGSSFAQLNLNNHFAHQAHRHGQPQPGSNNTYAQQGQDQQVGGALTTFTFYGAQGGHGAGGNGGL